MNVPRFNTQLLFFYIVIFQSNLTFCPRFFRLIKQCDSPFVLVNINVARIENMLLIILHL